MDRAVKKQHHLIYYLRVEFSDATLFRVMLATPLVKSNEFMLTFGLFVGYGLYSLLRKSYSVALPFMRATLSLSKSDVGNIATSFSVAYGISKFIGGVVSDFLPPEAMFSIGLFLTALSNLFFSFSTSTTVLCIFWFFNGTVQGEINRANLNHHYFSTKNFLVVNQCQYLSSSVYFLIC